MNKYEFLIHSIAHLDIHSVDLLLDEHRTYQDMEKRKFIMRLKDAMTDFMVAGDRQLIPYPGICGSCVKGCIGYSFVGPNSTQHMDLIIHTEDGEITDIFTCSLLKLEQPIKLGDAIKVKSDYQLPELGVDPPF